MVIRFYRANLRWSLYWYSFFQRALQLKQKDAVLCTGKGTQCTVSILHLIVLLFMLSLSYLSEHAVPVLMKITCMHQQIKNTYSLLLNSFTDLYSNRLVIALILLLLIACAVKHLWLKSSVALHIRLKCWPWGNSKTMRHFTALTPHPLKLRDRLSVRIHTPCGSKPEIRPSMSWEMAPGTQNGRTQVSYSSAACSDGDKQWTSTNPHCSCRIHLSRPDWTLTPSLDYHGAKHDPR